MIPIRLNGSEISVAASTVADLLAELGLPASLHLVELNKTALLRSEWPTAQLHPGDQIEILRVSAGG